MLTFQYCWLILPIGDISRPPAKMIKHNIKRYSMTQCHDNDHCHNIWVFQHKLVLFFSIIVPSSGALVVSHKHPIHVLASWCVILFARYDDKRLAALIILAMCSWSKRVELGKSRCCFEFCSCAIWLQLLLLWKAFICGRSTLHCSQPSSDWQNIHFFQLHSTGLQSLFGPNFVSFQISCNIKCAQQWKERKQWKSKMWKKSFWERVEVRDLVQRLDFLGGKAPPVIEQLKRGKSISKRWGNSCLSFLFLK